ncbi:MAG: RNA polymerase sigma factor [Gemmataceae bacterium]
MARGSLSSLMPFLRRLAPRGADSDDDGGLLQRFAANGDQDAFQTLLARHGPMVWNTCRRILEHEEEAEDAFQAVFIVLCRRAAKLEGRSSIAGWLHTVARHAAQRVRLRQHRRRLREQEVAAMPTTEPSDNTTWQELRPVLDEEVGRLPERYRAPVVLCYLEGKTNEEAARLLRWPVGSVKGRLARARELLRARLARRGLSLSVVVLSELLTAQTRAEQVPAALTRSVTQHALASTAAGRVPAPLDSLAQEVLRTMWLAKIRSLAVVVGALLLVLAGGLAFYPIANNALTAPVEIGQPPEAQLPKVQRKVALQFMPLQGIYQGEVVIRSLEQWRAARQANNFRGDPDSLDFLDKNIDFTKQMLVVVDGGYCTNVCTVDFLPLERDKKTLYIRYRLNDSGDTALAHPLAILVMDRFDGPIEVVKGKEAGIHRAGSFGVETVPRVDIGGSRVLRSAAEWKDFRQKIELHPHDNHQPPHLQMDLAYLDNKVDWNRCMLLVIDGGHHGSVHHIRVGQPALENDVLMVPFRVVGTGQKALSHPVTLVLIDRSPGKVEFNER